MNKQTLKQSKIGILGDPSLYDTHRIIPKHKGGDYVPGNVGVLAPVAHMQVHNNYREREESLDKLKVIMDDRLQILRSVNTFDNRLRAVKRGTDILDSKVILWLEEKLAEAKKILRSYDKDATEQLMLMRGNYPIIDIALAVDGVGPITVANMLVYVDISKARYASSLWAYVGYDKPSHERYKKNVSGGGNKTLRTALFATATSFIKRRNPYREIYDNAKRDYNVSENTVKSRNTQGNLIECAWKDVKDCHKHGAAIRKMMKHYLADLWYVWRTVEGLDTPLLYPEAKLGHKGIIRPEERGWVY